MAVALIIVGALLVTGGAAMVSVPLAIIVGGVIITSFGIDLARDAPTKATQS